MIDVYKIIERTDAEGPYTRFCIWTQGCHRHCLGCWAKDTWNFGAGQKYSVDKLFGMIQDQKDFIDGVTFLGGEPFEQVQELALLSQKIKKLGLSVVAFSGYTFEELKLKNDKYIDKFLSYIDLLIDGGFEQDKFDLSRPWVGSSNQRYIFLTDRFNQEIINQFKNRVEIRINKYGKVEMNGMGDFKNLQENFCLHLGADKV